MDLEDQYDKLYRYCYFRVRDVQTAEDLVQETFLRWLDHYPGQREREALPTLYTIARNLCVDVTRQRETLPLQETDQVAADPAGTLVERWDLERALETLTPRTRNCCSCAMPTRCPCRR
ncbi:MAG: RNA polymerase sigma factor [Evtepia gabavorous]